MCNDSDVDQTPSLDDSGHTLRGMLGIAGFDAKVAGLSRLNLVQHGAELTYLLRHDPESRRVRTDWLTFRDGAAAVSRAWSSWPQISQISQMLLGTCRAICGICEIRG